MDISVENLLVDAGAKKSIKYKYTFKGIIIANLKMVILMYFAIGQ